MCKVLGPLAKLTHPIRHTRRLGRLGATFIIESTYYYIITCFKHSCKVLLSTRLKFMFFDSEQLNIKYKVI